MVDKVKLEELKSEFEKANIDINEIKGRWASVINIADNKLETYNKFGDELSDWIQSAVDEQVEHVKANIEERINVIEDWVQEVEEIVASFVTELDEKRGTILNDLENLPTTLSDSLNQLQTQSDALTNNALRETLGSMLTNVQDRFRQTLEHVHALPEEIDADIQVLIREVVLCQTLLNESMQTQSDVMQEAQAFADGLFTNTFAELQKALLVFQEVEQVKLLQSEKFLTQ